MLNRGTTRGDVLEFCWFPPQDQGLTGCSKQSKQPHRHCTYGETRQSIIIIRGIIIIIIIK